MIPGSMLVIPLGRNMAAVSKAYNQYSQASLVYNKIVLVMWI